MQAVAGRRSGGAATPRTTTQPGVCDQHTGGPFPSSAPPMPTFSPAASLHCRRLAWALRAVGCRLPAAGAARPQGEELSAAYASSDIFVMPSESETLGFVVLEAMASQLPVVAVRAGGIPDIIRPHQNGEAGRGGLGPWPWGGARRAGGGHTLRTPLAAAAAHRPQTSSRHCSLLACCVRVHMACWRLGRAQV